ncbi:bifunctional diaminohydroxyphosphoribosylaminopyrimidine deaminase/5-amino-6-(5-phosphoribosylamino)uracil reductase RibD [Pseudoteredinibacter isoporae]|uniref:Pyrimidine deaminase RibD-like protein n=1 Tax=Pseudoteredinibacter isoporae TaxID=570281 RepID=A0A7X0MWC4_9GAMM|nr:bifunctional diaminohydroxyphosphoribosylaminopyrimidine deaminase/5-amino-6-(5-phosphoribosylamino)uracil reductase RibD [Pseudoteredinibacter isoporae]MBB6520789.1 pyrimidine deaminase RibD-like protein [Pseudoteredinibacter isoporae]NHO86355.1 diaminohydroxyphosphoribosylaminopyrimidine deaminase [Pseudoteredinibacter isoporae]NIB25193.1 diaminohydroxyphosphoribosylaminopyrimidine deaminase [Pseudoteredinibacter isoporae]
MSDTDTHRHFMLRALALSRKALPACCPNPPVACVLVKNGEIVSEGYTQAIGGNHAEVEALNAFPGDKSEVVAYVTLEPCSFVGRTGACAQALIDSGIRKVFVAMIDPDPRNNGKGLAMLEAAGVCVELACCEQEVSEFLGAYLGMS